MCPYVFTFGLLRPLGTEQNNQWYSQSRTTIACLLYLVFGQIIMPCEWPTQNIIQTGIGNPIQREFGKYTLFLERRFFPF